MSSLKFFHGVFRTFLEISQKRSNAEVKLRIFGRFLTRLHVNKRYNLASGRNPTVYIYTCTPKTCCGIDRHMPDVLAVLTQNSFIYHKKSSVEGFQLHFSKRRFATRSVVRRVLPNNT